MMHFAWVFMCEWTTAMCRSRRILDIGPHCLSCLRQGSFVGGHCCMYARVVGWGASRILLFLPFCFFCVSGALRLQVCMTVLGFHIRNWTWFVIRVASTLVTEQLPPALFYSFSIKKQNKIFNQCKKIASARKKT